MTEADLNKACERDYLDINPHTFKYLILDKEGKNIKWKKKAYLINGAGITGHQHVEK